jgi:thiol-disulfide isomerase/thioredoxin
LLLGFGIAQATDKKEPAPSFHAETTDGINHTNESINGKGALLEFWTTWCPDCAGQAHFVDYSAKEKCRQGPNHRCQQRRRIQEAREEVPRR